MIYNAYQNPYPQYYPQYAPQSPYLPQNQQVIQNPNNVPSARPQSNLATKFDVVQGELAANMYQTENGQEVILVDMDNPFVYRKKRGLDGKLEPMEKYKLVKEEQEKQDFDVKDFVKQEEIAAIVENMVKKEIDKKLSEITLKPSTRKKGEE